MSHPVDCANKARQFGGYRVFILCAGDGVRWNDYLGVPKQLVAFNGESLVERITRLLREISIDDIVCVRRDPRIDIHGTKTFNPVHFECLAATILSTATEWGGRTIFLLGDVFYTRSAVRKIIGFAGEIAAFGRPWSNRMLRCNHGELFALSFDRSVALKFTRVATDVRQLFCVGASGNLWDIYHTLTGLPLNSGKAERHHFVVVDDLTNDFDTSEDYLGRRTIYSLATSARLWRRAALFLMIAAWWPVRVIRRRPVAIKQIHAAVTTH